MTVTGTNQTSALICQMAPVTSNIVINIEQSVTNLCVHATNATLNLTADSWWPEGFGTVLWSSDPSGLGGETVAPDGRSYAFDPRQSTPGSYTVTASYSLLPEFQDTCAVNVIEVEYSIHHVCTTGVHDATHQIEVTLTPPPTGTNIVFELRRDSGANGAAIFTENESSTISIDESTALTVQGTEASSAVSNMVLEARLGDCVCTQALFTVVDLLALTATDAGNASNTINDTTQADDTNTLYLAQGTNGTASIALELTWQPAGYPEEAFLWEILPDGGSSGVAEWGGVTNGEFADQPLTNIWDVAHAAGGVTNREFQVRAWFDCNTNGLCDADEPVRVIDVVIIKVDAIVATSPVANNSPHTFEGHKTDFGNPCDPADPGQALVVFHKNVRDEDFMVQDFDVDLHAEVLPSTISDSDLSESWTKTSGPGSGALNKTDTFDVKYQNPTKGGLYQFEFDLGLDGCENSGANLLLPLGGPDVTDYLLSEAQRYEDWLITMKTRVQSVSDSDWVKAAIILGHTKRTVAAMLHREGTYEAGDSPCKQFCPGTITVEQFVFRKDFLGNFLFGYLSSKIKITLGSAKLAAWVIGEGGDDPDDYAAIDAGYQHGWASSTDLKQTLENQGIESMQVETAKRGWPSTDVTTGSEYPTWGATPGPNPD